MPRYSDSVTVEATASTAAASADFSVQKVLYLVNDDAAESIIFSFDGPEDPVAGEAGAFTLKPGESINNFDIEVRRLRYKAVAGTPSFRALGLA